MAEGLTLSLSGISNVQDGGDMIGNPSVQDFTGNSFQFFHVITMDVYTYDFDVEASKREDLNSIKNTNSVN